MDSFQTIGKLSKDEPALLVLDNHANHISLRVYNDCRDNVTIKVSVPPHTSHRSEPFDLLIRHLTRNVTYIYTHMDTTESVIPNYMNCLITPTSKWLQYRKLYQVSELQIYSHSNQTCSVKLALNLLSKPIMWFCN